MDAYLAATVDEAVYKAKTGELRAEAAKVEENLASLGDVDPAGGETALALFDFTQNAAARWLGSNHRVRREILDLVCLNRRLSDVNLVATKRKPFDVFAEGLILEKSRGDSRFTIVHETPGWRLARLLLPKTIEFSGEKVLSFSKPGLYSKRR